MCFLFSWRWLPDCSATTVCMRSWKLCAGASTQESSLARRWWHESMMLSRDFRGTPNPCVSKGLSPYEALLVRGWPWGAPSNFHDLANAPFGKSRGVKAYRGSTLDPEPVAKFIIRCPLEVHADNEQNQSYRWNGHWKLQFCWETVNGGFPVLICLISFAQFLTQEWGQTHLAFATIWHSSTLFQRPDPREHHVSGSYGNLR